MLISNLNLYKAGWLDLVFENRNKEYGAYELRLNNGRNTVRAMGITFFGVAVLCAANLVFHKATPHTLPIERLIPVVIAPPPVLPIKKIVEPPAKPLRSEPPAKPIATQRVLPPVAVPDQIAAKPVETTEITKAIGTVDSKGSPETTSVIPEIKTSGDGGTQPALDNTVHDTGTLDVMPAPVGGDKAWANFLNKNLRFPGEAQDQDASGKVFLSFIIEKDGHLSNIMLINKAGYGFDEEALRVLKLAKAWKPGYANGQPVRVKFTLPITFQVAEQ